MRVRARVRVRVRRKGQGSRVKGQGSRVSSASLWTHLERVVWFDPDSGIAVNDQRRNLRDLYL